MIVINFFLSILMSIISPKFLLEYLDFISVPFEFRLKIFALSLLNFVISFFIEKIFLYGFIADRLLPWIKSGLRLESKKIFNIIEKEINADNWPNEQEMIYEIPYSNNNNNNKNDNNRMTKASSIHF